jgi:hypothetical protein
MSASLCNLTLRGTKFDITNGAVQHSMVKGRFLVGVDEINRGICSGSRDYYFERVSILSA